MSQAWFPDKPNFLERLRRGSGPLILLLLMGLLVWLLVREAGQNYRWQWYRVWRQIGTFGSGGFQPGPLLFGLWTTLKLTGASLLLSFGSGGLLCAMRLSPSPPARLLAILLIAAVRNTPLLLQLFLIYFVLAPALGLGQFAAAVLALGLFEGAYLAEVFRAGLGSLPKSQWEAALSLGFGVRQALGLVILPQALRRIVAPMVNQIVSLIKDSALVSAIAVADLTMRARVIITDTFLSFEIWLLTAAIYLVLTLLISLPAKVLESRPSST